MPKPTFTSLFALALFSGFSATSFAQYTSTTQVTRDILTPNTGTWNAGGVFLNGTQFINLGLQGVGRIAANSTQSFAGGITETLGSISDLQISGFAPNGLGGYTGTFNFLPDRGYNSGATFSNYAARINTFDFTFTPYTSSAITAAQNQIVFSNPSSTRFTYDADPTAGTDFRFTTGLLASGTTTLSGIISPAQAAATTINDTALTNRLTLDTEGLILDPRVGKTGSGWVGDEYGAYIYHFNASKQIDGIVTLPQALIPHSPVGTTNFSTSPANLNGRRENQGMEGIAISPDGTKLFALLQSATLQDSGSGNQGRSNTRVLVYDISGSDTPTDPVAQYVIQLPRMDDNGATGGSAVNRTGAQSAIIAISDTQFLVLSRDGNGRGANNGAPVFKSVLLADLSTATNIDGTYDAEGNAVAPGGVLAAGVTPIAWTEALNMLGKLDLSVSELEQFGLNMLASNGDTNTISEKWEGLGLVPTGTPDEYFLFIGNDNDFQTQTGSLLQADGTTATYNAGLENDTMVLAYRVQIAAVPEPGSALLLGLGATALVGFRRRRSA